MYTKINNLFAHWISCMDRPATGTSAFPRAAGWCYSIFLYPGALIPQMGQISGLVFSAV